MLVDVEALFDVGWASRSGDAIVWAPRRCNRVADRLAGKAMKAQCSAAWVALASAWRGLEALKARKWVIAADAGYSDKESKAGLGWYVAELKSRQVMVLVGSFFFARVTSFKTLTLSRR